MTHSDVLFLHERILFNLVFCQIKNQMEANIASASSPPRSLSSVTYLTESAAKFNLVFI